MGAWSIEIYGNDTAADWAWSLDDASGFEVVAAALDAVLAEDEYLDAALGEEGLAAAEALTFVLGRPGRSSSYTKSVENWASRMRSGVPAELIGKAEAAIQRILGEDSELRELWEESGEGEAWQDEARQLLLRLKG